MYLEFNLREILMLQTAWNEACKPQIIIINGVSLKDYTYLVVSGDVNLVLIGG